MSVENIDKIEIWIDGELVMETNGRQLKSDLKKPDILMRFGELSGAFRKAASAAAISADDYFIDHCPYPFEMINAARLRNQGLAVQYSMSVENFEEAHIVFTRNYAHRINPEMN